MAHWFSGSTWNRQNDGVQVSLTQFEVVSPIKRNLTITSANLFLDASLSLTIIDNMM
jgi:hypothetical protein